MLITTFLFEILFTIFFPFILGIWLIRRFKTGWGLFWVGAATFIGSQIVHIPMLSGLTVLVKALNLPFTPQTGLIFNAVVLGLAAGICEETARWIGYRLLKGRGQSFGAAVTLAAGHGGIESVLLAGLTVSVNLALMLLVTHNPSALSGLGQETLIALQNAAGSFWAMSPTLPLAGAFERLVAITLHTSLSLMVWLAVTRRNALWFWAGVLWHAVVDGVTVYLSGLNILTAWQLEGVLAISMVLSAAFIWWVYCKEKGAAPTIITPVDVAPVQVA